MMSDHDDEDFESLYQRGLRFRQFGETAAAIDAFRSALQINPDHVESLVALGNLLEEDWKLDEARSQYSRAVEVDPEALLPRQYLGRLESSTGHFEEAVKALKTYQELGGEDVETLLTLAEAASKVNDCKTVLKATKAVLDLDDSAYKAWELRGICYAHTEKYNEACICLNMAIDLHPSSIEALNAVGDVCYQNENYHCSSEFFESSLKVRSEQPDIMFKYATSLWFLDRWSEAVPLFEKYTSLRPEDARGWNNLGVVLREKGDVKRSVECYRKALELDPNLEVVKSNMETAMNMQVLT